jgi:hypothetical protein
MLMSDDQRSPRGRRSRDYDFRHWGDENGEPAEDARSSRPTPRPRARRSRSFEDEPPESGGSGTPMQEFDNTGGAQVADEPHRFDISGYREGLYGGPGAELIGGNEFTGSWDSPREEPQSPTVFPVIDPELAYEARDEEPDIPAARVNGQQEQFVPAESNSLVRPYTKTGGRTRSEYDLAVEALVSTSPQGLRSQGVVSPEQQSICGLCVDTRSVAEVAAHLRLPLGVARVLIGDMAGMGLVLVHQSSALAGDRPSMEFLERVLSGLRRL